MSVIFLQYVRPVLVVAELISLVICLYLFTAYLETFDTHRTQEMEHIQETQGGIVAVLEQMSRVEKVHAQHAHQLLKSQTVSPEAYKFSAWKLFIFSDL